MVLSLSIWDDNLGRMLWLDGKKSSTQDIVGAPGVARGPCEFSYGSDKDEQKYAKEHGGGIDVTFSSIKYGDIGSTYPSTAQLSQEFELGTGVAELSHSHWRPQAVAAVGFSVIAGLAFTMALRLRKADRSAQPQESFKL